MVGAVPFVLIAAGLLLAAGISKLRDPAPTARALRLLLPGAGASLVRVGAAAEVVIAVALVVVAGPLPAALGALAYVGFALFVVLARRRGGPLTSCGCFGRDDTPATRGHAVVNLGLAAALAVWAATGERSPWSVLTDDGPVTAALALGSVALAATLVAATLTVLPQVDALRTTTAARR
ncbi:MAG: hypothetical protein S0880_08740 [Actinomycetota bacterium]|nr:hypothetical protein [Actinomycetota bacterium]